MIFYLLALGVLRGECAGLREQSVFYLHVSRWFMPKIGLRIQLVPLYHFRFETPKAPRHEGPGSHIAEWELAIAVLLGQTSVSSMVCRQPSFYTYKPFFKTLSTHFLFSIYYMELWQSVLPSFRWFSEKTLSLVYFWYFKSGPVIIWVLSFNILKICFYLRARLPWEENR